MIDSQSIIGTALIDAKQHLMRIDGVRQLIQPCHFRLTALQPANRTGTGRLYIIKRCWIFNTFIKRHCNGGSKMRLNLHAFFRPHKDTPSINMRLKVNALFLNLSQFCKRKYLEPTAVRQNWLLPIHKAMQTTHFLNHLIART